MPRARRERLSASTMRWASGMGACQGSAGIVKRDFATGLLRRNRRPLNMGRPPTLGDRSCSPPPPHRLQRFPRPLACTPRATCAERCSPRARSGSPARPAWIALCATMPAAACSRCKPARPGAAWRRTSVPSSFRVPWARALPSIAPARTACPWFGTCAA